MPDTRYCTTSLVYTVENQLISNFPTSINQSKNVDCTLLFYSLFVNVNGSLKKCMNGTLVTNSADLCSVPFGKWIIPIQTLHCRIRWWSLLYLDATINTAYRQIRNEKKKHSSDWLDYFVCQIALVSVVDDLFAHFKPSSILIEQLTVFFFFFSTKKANLKSN